MRRTTIRIAACLAVLPSMALAEQPRPPTLDCGQAFEATLKAAQWMPGARPGRFGSFETIAIEEPQTWQVEYAFTTPGHAAHPAVVMRTQIRQVTEVWTAQSIGCGYGDSSAFASLMADAKSRDTELTNASRADVERAKSSSPLDIAR